MASTATLIPVSVPNSNLIGKTLESTKHKNPEDLLSRKKNQPVHSSSSNSSESIMITEDETKNGHNGTIVNGSNRNVSSFRIPKLNKTKESTSPPQLDTQCDNQSIEDSNNQQGKRKFSLHEYKVHKRLKSDEPTFNSSQDVDMRIDIKQQPRTVKKEEPKQVLIKKSNLSEPGVKQTIKKKVIWADEKQKALVQTSFFEIDEIERANMHYHAHHGPDQISFAQIEKLLERDLRQQQTHENFDEKRNLPSLPPLIRILLPNTIKNPELQSHQRVVQEAREQTVLKALSIRSFLPDSPIEPDGDSSGPSTNEVKVIPLEDNSSSHELMETTTVKSPTTISEPVSTPMETLSPQVAQILAAAKEKLTTTSTIPSIPPPLSNPIMSTPNPVLTMASASNLLQLLLNGLENKTAAPVNPLANLLSNPSLHLPVPMAQPFPPVTSLFPNPLSLPMLPNNLSPPTSTTFNNSATPHFDNPSNQGAPRFPNGKNPRRPNNNHRGHHYRPGFHQNNRRNFHGNRNGYS